MKYRSDFVTNSSSSSFICVFKSEKELLNSFYTLLTKEGVSDEYSAVIARDLLNEGKRLTRKEVIDMIKRDIESDVRYNKIFSNYRLSLEELKAMDEDPKLKQEIKEIVEKRLKDIIKGLPKKGIYSCLEYGDDDGDFYGTLEWNIMPYLSFVFYKINHH